MKSFSTVEQYLKSVPKKFLPALTKLRATIKKAAPSTKEDIRYGMPTFRYKDKNLVHYAAFKDHLSFFPGGTVKKYARELKGFKTSKGTIQFTIDKPLPSSLVTKIVKDNIKAIEKRIIKTCSRGHKFSGSTPCPVCYPGYYRKGRKKS